jgi:spore coat polysaccharide biosynthesis protein SpsF (cytidylyltransferase family)
MLGIIVSGVSEDGSFNEAVYHKFGETTIFERTIDNALKCEFAQKVIVSAPASERRNIGGSGIFTPLIKGNRSQLNRKALIHFYSNQDDTIAGIYQAALSYGLDHIVLVRANCPILPAWLINNMIYDYMRNTNQNVYLSNRDPVQLKKLNYNIGLEVSIFPFWMLAEKYLYDEERTNLRFKMPEEFTSFYGNVEGKESYLPPGEFDLRFLDLDRREEFDFLMSELAKGADLGELIEDLNEPEES